LAGTKNISKFFFVGIKKAIKIKEGLS